MKNYADMTNAELSAALSERENKYRSEQQNISKLAQDIQSKLPSLALGGMEDINKIIWPYLAVTGRSEIAPDRTESSFITITQEAGMVITHMSRVVFEKVADGGQPSGFRLDYVNPRIQSNAALLDGLKLQILDAQSRRKYMQNAINLNVIGDVTDEYRFSSPQYIAPNSQLEIQLSNSSSSKTYVGFIMMRGYKMRLEEAQKMLSLQHL